MTILSNELVTCAALAELIYSRAPEDQAITLDDINDGTGNGLEFFTVPPSTEMQELNIVQSSSGMFYSARGFAGAIVRDSNNNYVVVLRGTDMGGNLDVLDWTEANVPLGVGSAGTNQCSDALALARLALQLAGSVEKVIVTGQSLGGGLAGLVSAALDVKGYGIAPAPFDAQISTIALMDIAAKYNIPVDEVASYPNYLAEAVSLAGTYRANVRTNLELHTHEGEILSSGTPLYVLDALAEHFSVDNSTRYNLGEADNIALHGPSGHLLTITTEASETKRFRHLTSDDVFRAALFDIPGISGAMDSDRADVLPAGDIGSSSKVTASGANPTALMRALWKSFVSDNADERKFYDYFHQLFGTHAKGGAAAEGLHENGVYDGTLSLHSGIVKIALGILRDAVEGTATLSALYQELGGSWNFAGGTEGNLFDDKVVLNIDHVTSTNEEQMDVIPAPGTATRFGERDISLALFDRIVASQATEGVGIYIATQVLDRTQGNIINGDVLDWSILVAQAGAGTSMNYDAERDGTDGEGYENKSHVIFGGSGGDTIKGSTQTDYMSGSGGANYFESGGGKDVIVGGNDRDVYVARVTGTGADGGVTFLGSGGNTDAAVYGTDFDLIELTINASELANFVGVVGAEVRQNGVVTDTLVGVEYLWLSSGNEHVGFQYEARELGLHFEFLQGDTTIRMEKTEQGAPTTQDGAGTTYSFRSHNADGSAIAGPQRQNIVVDQDFDQAASNASWLYVDGKQLVGGAAFDFDKFDVIGGAYSALIDRLNVPLGPPWVEGEVSTTDRVSDWMGEHIQEYQRYLGGIAGASPAGTPATAFGIGAVATAALMPVLYGDLLRLLHSWNSLYYQAILGTHGELYLLANDSYDSNGRLLSADLTIVMPDAQAEDYEIKIDGWRQGDFGIRIEALQDGAGLETGTNKNGKVDHWADMSLAEIRDKLAGLGFTAKEVPMLEEPGKEGSGGSGGGGSEPSAGSSFGATREGNAQVNFLVGTDYDDIINGGKGNDTLDGGKGRDTYLFAAGDGADIITDLSAEGSIIRFLNGLDPSTVTKTLVAGANGLQDLLITYGAGDTIRIVGWSSLTLALQGLWTFEGVSADISSPDSSKTPDLSVIPDTMGGGASTLFNGTDAADKFVDLDIAERFNAGKGNDHIIANGGGDVVNGNDGDDLLDAGGGNDHVNGDAGNDTILGGGGDDDITGGSGNDQIIGGAGNDDLNGGSGTDLYIFGKGDEHDRIDDQDGEVHIAGVVPADIVIARNLGSTDDLILAIKSTDDSVRLVDQPSDSGLTVTFDDGTKWTIADLQARYMAEAQTTGDDDIIGFSRNDTLSGGLGNDSLHGAEGSDTYVWNRGDGNDVIHENNDTADIDSLILGPGIATSDFSFARPNDTNGDPTDDLVITIGGSNGGTITLDQYFSYESRGVERIVFADGTVYRRADIYAMYLSQQVTAGNDTVNGTQTGDAIDGSTGNDVLEGRGGADTLNGGAGNDRLEGSYFTEDQDGDTYRFDAGFGQDVVFDNEQVNYRGADRAVFTAHNLDDFTITRSDQTGLANLTLAVNGGSDKVTVEEFLYRGQIEQYVFADGLTLSQTAVAAIADRTSATNNQISGNGSAETLNGAASHDRLYAESGNDVAAGGAGNDVLYGGTGNDQLSGEGDDDLLFGGIGNDALDGGAGNDLAFGGAGDDSAAGGTGNDVLHGNAGTDTLAGGEGADELHGDSGDDNLSGNVGADTLIGGDGNDTYSFNQGDGADVIDAGDGRGATDIEHLVLGGGITIAELNYAFEGRDLVITFDNTPGDSLRIKEFLGSGWLSSMTVGATTLTAAELLETLTGATAGADDIGSVAVGTEQSVAYGGRGNDRLVGNIDTDYFLFRKGDGVDLIEDYWGPVALLAKADQLVLGGGIAAEDLILSRYGADGGNLRITFTTGSDQIDLTRQFHEWDFSGGVESIRFENGIVWDKKTIRQTFLAQSATASADVIEGFIGADDTITGGAGNDTLRGASGDDVYLFNSGDGKDVVEDSSGQDELRLGAGIVAGALTVARSGAGDAVLTISANDSITLKDVFAGAGVERIVFADGTVWTKAELAQLAAQGAQSAGNDVIAGTSHGETIAGGQGNDSLQGGDGGDTYIYEQGDGTDTIVEAASAALDRLHLGAGILPGGVTVRHSATDASDLVIDFGNGETITVENQFGGDGAGLEQIQFANGESWSRDVIAQKALLAGQSAGDDTLTGSSLPDDIAGGKGNDAIDGRAGGDVYAFNRGDGKDTVAETGDAAGKDSIVFGADISALDVDLKRGAGDDLVISIRGTDDQIVVKNHFTSSLSGVEIIRFADGMVWGAEDIVRIADNQAPTASTAIANQGATQGQAFSFAVPAGSFADADVDDSLTYRATLADGSPLPGWLTFNGTSFSGTPQNGDVGTFQIKLSAVDEVGDTVSQQFEISVGNVNDAPVAALVVANQNASTGAAFSYQLPAGLFVDPDNGLPGVPTQTISVSATLAGGAPLPSWLSFDPNTLTFSGTPQGGDQAALDIVLTATDGTASGTTRFGIQVGGGNAAPTAGTAISAQAAAEDALFSFQVPGSAFADSTPGDRLRYSATLAGGQPLPSWLSIDAISGVLSGTPANGDVGALSIRVTATDIAGGSANTTFTLNVTNANDAPLVMGAPESWSITEDVPFFYELPSGLFSDQDVGDTLTLSALQQDGSALPSWLSFDPVTRTLSGTPVDGDAGMLNIVIKATDNAGASAQSSVYILVNGTNDAPFVLDPIKTLEAERNLAFSHIIPAGTFGDADSPGISITVAMENGDALPSWMTFDPMTWTLSGTPDHFSVGTDEGFRTYRVAVTATDSDGASVTDVVNFVVRGPNAGAFIQGGNGNETLFGTAGPDLIDGGAGNDQLQGKEGKDIYLIGKASGHDTALSDWVVNGKRIYAEDDIVEFAAAVTPDDVTVSRAGSVGDRYDLVLSVNGTESSITIEDQFAYRTGQTFSGVVFEIDPSVEQVRFADGTVWTAADLAAKFMTGGAGNDEVLGNTKNNTLTGAAGNDTIYGQRGDDTISGGTGSDTLDGGIGDDTYIFELGDGKDRITDESYEPGFDTLKFGAGITAGDLVFTRNPLNPHTSLDPEAGSLLIEIKGTSDSILIYDQYDIYGGLSHGVDEFVFANGTVLTREDIDFIINPSGLVEGTSGNDTLIGGSLDERIVGKAGADELSGNDGDDTYVWNIGDGNDVISEDTIDSFDVLELGAGISASDISLSREFLGYNLLLTYVPTGEVIALSSEFSFEGAAAIPYPVIDLITFANGDSWDFNYLINHFLASTPGDDLIEGFERRPDVMNGGAGNDTLEGGSHHDTYVFGRGYGVDLVVDFYNSLIESGIGPGDKIAFDKSVASTEVQFERVLNVTEDGDWDVDTELRIIGTSDKIVGNFSSITQVSFGKDGAVRSWTTLQNQYYASHQTAGDDVVIGTGGGTLSTLAGNDRLYGADTMIGGEGNDTYLFRSSSDGFVRDDGKSDDFDTLEFAPNVGPGDVTLVRANNGNDLYVRVELPGGGEIVLSGFYVSAAATIEQIRFADGTTWSAAVMASMAANAPADNNPVVGTAGNDSLSSSNTARFDGLGGNDTITGTSGSDIYLYRAGSGNDIIIENTANAIDTIRLEGLNLDDVTIIKGNPDLIIQINSSGETLTIKDQLLASSDPRIDEVVFADKTVLDSAQLAKIAYLAGTDGNDSLSGTSGNDTILAGLGNDIITNGSGADVVIYKSGDGNDVVDDNSTSNSEVDVLKFSNLNAADVTLSHVGTDIMIKVNGTGHQIEIDDFFASTTQNKGVDQIVFADGTTWSRSHMIAEAWIRGTVGTDSLSGSAFDDVFDAGTGNDTVVSSTGSDTFVYESGDGNDLIDETATSTVEIDTLRFIGINAGDVTFSHVGTDLIAKINATGQQIEVNNHFSSTASNVGVDRVVFDDGTIWNRSQITAAAWYRGTTGDDLITGSAFDDVMFGDAGDDTLNGAAGVDSLTGATGNDTYVVDNTNDIVVENAGEGTDLVQASATYELSAEVENLTLTGTGPIGGTGNGLANFITGNTGANTLLGLAGNDMLDGGTGNDSLAGGADDDTYFVDATGDVVTESAGEGTDLVFATANTTLGANVENLTLTGAGAISGTGNADANFITGNTAANTLAGLGGADTLDGGGAADTASYAASATGVTASLATGGGSGGDAEGDVFISIENLTGSNFDDTIEGDGNANVLAGGGGIDTVTYVNAAAGVTVNLTTATAQNTVGAGSDTLSGFENATGSAFNDTLTGTTGGNALVGLAGNDTLDGAAGADTLTGGTGNDTYVVDNAGDVVTESNGEGTDLVQAAVAHVLAANVENLTLTGTATAGTGNTESNSLTGNASDNVLTGLAGADTLNGAGGNDTAAYADSAAAVTVNLTSGTGAGGDAEGDVLSNIEHLSGSGHGDALTGSGGANAIAGLAGDDTLDGAAGNDTLTGGQGNDTYVVDATADVVTEMAGEGTDTVQAGATFSLTANVENLTLTGTGAFNGTGNAEANVLAGNAGANVLAGLGGADTLDGGDGADTASYAASASAVTASLSIGVGGGGDAQGDSFVSIENLTGSNFDDTLEGGAGANVLAGGSGIDTLTYVNATAGVAANLSVATSQDTGGAGLDTLSAFENLTGSSFNDVLTGNTGGNVLTGLDGSDTLNGGAGTDTMIGGLGNDTYVLDTALDTLTETVDGGVDTAQSSVTYTLAINVENLLLLGTSVIHGTGNDSDNFLTGNTKANTLTGGIGNDTLDGAAGNDSLVGGVGDDTYVVDSAADVTIELAGEGIDTIYASLTLTSSLAVNTENLVLTGTGAINGNGNGEANVLTGNSNTNVLDGKAGVDTLIGGLGSDTYVVDDSDDSVVESTDEGTDLVQSTATYTLSNNVENLTLTGTGTISGTGNGLGNVLAGNTVANTLSGAGGNDTLDGGDGDDTLQGGDGDDTLSGNLGKDSFDGGDGNDAADFKFVASANWTFDLGAGTATATGSGVVETLTSIEALYAGGGNDLITGSGNADSLYGGGGNDSITGAGGDDRVEGGAGNDTLHGGAGNDIAAGGAGNDLYTVDAAGDQIVEAAAEGTDLVQSAIDWTLSANVENLTLTGSSDVKGTGEAGNNTIVGNIGANTLEGLDGNDSLDGGAGNDTLIGGLGNDTFTVDSADDVTTESADEGIDLVQTGLKWTLGANVENLTLTGSSGVTGTGNELANFINGNTGANTLLGEAGNDTLNGGTGIDTMQGGLGDDTYVVDTGSDKTIEAVGEGIDLVQSAIAWTLATDSEIENLLLISNANVAGTGNALNNVVTGNAGNNSLGGLDGDDSLDGAAGNDTLTGGVGIDTLVGGAGNDTYVVDGFEDQMVELTGGGTDRVQTGVNWTLAEFFENLTLIGTSNVNGTGNAANNTIIGNAVDNSLSGLDGDDSLDGAAGNDTLDGGLGNDTLNGNGGADSMTGGAGNDTYFVDSLSDEVKESEGGGTDLIQSSISIPTLAANVENLTLTGTAISVIGNDLDNALTGNNSANDLQGGIGNDTLNGGSGLDTLTGGMGNDLFVIEAATDVVNENADEGIDTIQTTVTINTLASNVENLTFTGSSNVTGIGNALDNTISGNTGTNTLAGGDGNDWLDGGTNADKLTGGLGNDTFVVDHASDQVVEVSGEGTDLVRTSLATYTLGSNVENLTLTGANTSGTGNADANVIIGSGGNNTLTGGDGNDTLDGGLGSDTLNGGIGADLYQTTRGGGGDRISVSASDGEADALKFGATVNYDQLWFSQTGSDLVITIIGTNDKMTVEGWYTAGKDQLDRIEVDDGDYLLTSDVQGLVTAMASLTPPPLGQTDLTAPQQAQLAPALAASWHQAA